MTYPHDDVRAELSRWLERRIDVAEDPQLAAFFEVAAIPTAILLDGEGLILDRVVGFVKPADFVARLLEAKQSL